MQLTRRNVVKAGVALTATMSAPRLQAATGAGASRSALDVSSVVQVLPLTDASAAAEFASGFPNVSSHPLIKALLPASFLVKNVSAMPVHAMGAELWIGAGKDQYCARKLLQVEAGRSSIYSAHRPVLPANGSLLVTPFFSVTQQADASNSVKLSSKLLNSTVQKRFLLEKLAAAHQVDLTVNSLVVNRTELVGKNTQLQMQARVQQAGEHDLANRLRFQVNRGASPTEVAATLTKYLSKHQFVTSYLSNNRRIYVNAKTAYAKVLLQSLERDPVSFLRSIKASTLQKRVNFTFYRRSNGGSK